MSSPRRGRARAAGDRASRRTARQGGEPAQRRGERRPRGAAYAAAGHPGTARRPAREGRARPAELGHGGDRVSAAHRQRPPASRRRCRNRPRRARGRRSAPRGYRRSDLVRGASRTRAGDRRAARAARSGRDGAGTASRRRQRRHRAPALPARARHRRRHAQRAERISGLAPNRARHVAGAAQPSDHQTQGSGGPDPADAGCTTTAATESAADPRGRAGRTDPPRRQDLPCSAASRGGMDKALFRCRRTGHADRTAGTRAHARNESRADTAGPLGISPRLARLADTAAQQKEKRRRGCAVSLLILIGAVGLALFAYADTGHIVIAYGDWTVETSLALAVAAILLAFLALHYLIRLWVGLRAVPYRLRRWRRHRRNAKVQHTYQRGMIALAEGHWQEAEKWLLKHVHHSETPALHYLAAAEAAEEQGAHVRRDS